LLLATLTSPKPSFAEPLYTPKAIPNCKVVETKHDGTLCGYTLEQVKAIYKADNELVELRATKPLLESKILQLEAINLQHVAKEKALDEIVVRTDAYGKAQTEKYLKCDKDLQYEKAKPAVGSYIAWTIAGVATSVLAGVLLGRVVD
jgi:hypothetical protein